MTTYTESETEIANKMQSVLVNYSLKNYERQKLLKTMTTSVLWPAAKASITASKSRSSVRSRPVAKISTF